MPEYEQVSVTESPSITLSDSGEFIILGGAESQSDGIFAIFPNSYAIRISIKLIIEKRINFSYTYNSLSGKLCTYLI